MSVRPAPLLGTKLSTPLTDAWRTMVPATDDPHGPLPPLLLALTVVTGLVDAFSYLSLGHVFVANMTGNVIFLGFALAGVPGFTVAAPAVALAASALALGTQNAAVRKLAVPDLTTTVLTLTITGIFADGRLAGGTPSRVGRRLLSVLAVMFGALAGALLVLRVDAALAIAVASIILVVVVAGAAYRSREDRPWARPGKTR